MPKFFIDRPVFAWVVSLLIMLGGCLAITHLPVAQYPSVAPPSVSVSANYAGASAETVQNTVTTLLEQQMTGIDNLQYMMASSSASGQSQLTLYFKPGTNPDTAQVQVQNKVQLATPSLPQTVQQQGITVAKATRNFMMIVSLSCTNGSMDQYAVGNFVASSVLDSVRRVPGVGEADMFGSEYAMRVWLDPDKLNSFGLTANDVTSAISAQNNDVSVGQLGDLPAVAGQQLNVTLRAQTTFRTPAQFGGILLRVGTDGSRVLLRDVARVEFGGESYVMITRANGQPGTGIAIKLSPSANVLSTAVGVRAKIVELSKFFPAGISVDYPMDSSTFRFQSRK
jgi:multidrug efflux pump